MKIGFKLFCFVLFDKRISMPCSNINTTVKLTVDGIVKRIRSTGGVPWSRNHRLMCVTLGPTSSATVMVLPHIYYTGHHGNMPISYTVYK